MLEAKCIGDNFEMLMTAVFVTDILYVLILVSGTNRQKMSPTHSASNIRHQHRCSHKINSINLQLDSTLDWLDMQYAEYVKVFDVLQYHLVY